MRIWFDHAGKGLKTRGDGPVTGFSIAALTANRSGGRKDRGDDRAGLEPGRAESAVCALCVGLQPGREPDERVVAASVAVPDGRERRAREVVDCPLGRFVEYHIPKLQVEAPTHSQRPTSNFALSFVRLLGSWTLGVPWSLGFGAWDLTLYL